jgi:hypothetical protein
MGTQLNISIQFASGPDYVQSFPLSGYSFFGFVSSATDIKSAIIYGNGGNVAFAVDNFTFPTPGAPAAVPEPSTLAGAGIAVFLSLACAWRRRKAKRAA